MRTCRPQRGYPRIGYNMVHVVSWIFPFYRSRGPVGAGGCIPCCAWQDDPASKRGRKYKVPPPTSRIEVTILKDVNGKPIENAAVVFHPMVVARMRATWS